MPGGPDTVVIETGWVRLRGLLWRPEGRGPFPAVLFNHGRYTGPVPIRPQEPEVLGPVFAEHGYVFLFPFRRGIGLSADQGPSDGDLMAQALAAGGQEGLNRVQLELLSGEDLEEAAASLALLRALPDVDQQRVALAGHSFGGSLTLLLAARDSSPRAVVIFSGAALSWNLSPELRTRLLAAVGRTPPVLFLHTANDYSTASGRALAAEMRRLKRPHRLTIYPPDGTTAREGHNFVFRNVTLWEADVFAFLDSHLRH